MNTSACLAINESTTTLDEYDYGTDSCQKFGVKWKDIYCQKYEMNNSTLFLLSMY